MIRAKEIQSGLACGLRAEHGGVAIEILEILDHRLFKRIAERFSVTHLGVAALPAWREPAFGMGDVRTPVVGDDFQFARKRSGGIADLERKGAEHGFTVEQVGSVVEQGGRVSSSVVRAALESGDMETASRLLGSGYRMSGRVVRGQQLGRELGMPTANVKLKRRRSPVQGIFDH